MKIYPIFHISMLKLVYKEISIQDSIYIEINESEYEVEKILETIRNNEGEVKYLVKWKNYL